MKESELLLSPPAAGGAADLTSLFGKGRYKFWALAAILLLALWTMFTGTVTLKWSAGNLGDVADGLDTSIRDEIDVLEVEEREKVVRHMWDVYRHSQLIQVPRFWQEAFEAAYEQLASDDPATRDAAVSEIAKMSMRMVDPNSEHPPSRNAKAEVKNPAVKSARAKPSVQKNQ